MKRRLAAFLAMLAIALVGLRAPVPALADDVSTVKIDVAGAANGYYKADGRVGTSDDYCYAIEDARILLNSTNVVFELSGSTDKNVTIINYTKPVDAFNVRLNGVKLSNGIDIQNSGYATHVNVEVPAGTTNTVSKLIASNLTISGAGTLNAEYVGTSQIAGATLHITDTQINAQTSRNYSEFNGECVIDGNAVVMFTSSTDYSPLHVGETSRFKHSLTLRDNARLYCLYSNPDEVSNYHTCGLQLEGKLTLEGNSYLEANARPCTTADYNGDAVLSYSNDIEVLGNAKIVAKSYGAAVNVANVTVSGKGAAIEATSERGSGLAGDVVTVEDGGTIVANGKGSNGIYARVSAKFGKGAYVDLKGYWAAIWADDGDIEVNGAIVQAESAADVALFSKAGISINDSTVLAKGRNGDEAIRAWDDITVDGSWLDLASAGEKSMDATVTNSVVFDNTVGEVVGDAVTPSMPANNLIALNETLTIPEGTSLTVRDGATLTNDGVVTVDGTFSVGGGTLICNNHNGGTATCVSGALCDLCQVEYGDADPANHAGGLRLVEAVAATTTSEGNIEYWVCDDCGKLFADEAAEKEIQLADTVTPKLPEEQKPSDGEKPGDETKPADPADGTKTETKVTKVTKTTVKKLPAAGDATSALPAVAALLAGIALVGAVRTSRQR